MAGERWVRGCSGAPHSWASRSCVPSAVTARGSCGARALGRVLGWPGSSKGGPQQGEVGARRRVT